ncbi:MAG: hypothetical protein R3D25_11575 [Geminicoccaceae bacterium]
MRPSFFDAIAWALDLVISSFVDLLQAVPPVLLVLLFAAGAFAVHRSWKLALLIVLSLLLIINLGYWKETTETLALVVVATFTCMVIGVPVGIAAAHRPWLYALIRPILDLMQTIPTFVYLIPTLILLVSAWCQA